MRAEANSIMRHWVARSLIALCLSGGAVGIVSAQQFYDYPRRGYERSHSPADETIRHLEFLAGRTRFFNNGRERSRYNNALRNLSEFDSRLARGRFDKGKLDQAIADVQHLVDHNPLDGRARSMLWGDLNNLRAFRESRGGYGYGEYGRPRY